MRNLIVTTAVLLLALGIAIAQQPAATDTSSQTAAQQKSFRGCLGGSEGNFTLLDESGISYRLQGLADDMLKPHVGHTVEISGSVSSGAASSTSDSTTQPSGSNTGREQILMVSDLRMISEKCDVKATTPSSAAATETQPTPVEQVAAGTPAPETTVQAQTGAATAQQPATEPAIPVQEQQPSAAQEPQPVAEQAPVSAAAEPGQQETETAEGQLPMTASPLPLLAVLGLGAMAAGLVSRRKR
jgi:hypothetical protein